MWAFSVVMTVQPLLTTDEEFSSRSIRFDWQLWENCSTVLRWHQTVRNAHISFRIVLGSHIIMHQDPIWAQDGERDKTAEHSGYHMGCLHQNISSGWECASAFIAAHGDYWVKIFDTTMGTNQATFHKHTFIDSIAFSPDDNFLAIGISGGTNIWVCRQALCSEHSKATCKVYIQSHSLLTETWLQLVLTTGPFKSGTYYRVAVITNPITIQPLWLAFVGWETDKSCQDQMIVQSTNGMSSRQIAQAFMLDTPLQ